MKFKNDIEAQSNIILDGALADAGGSPGTVNQLLSSTATGTAWIDPSTIVAEAATLVVIACKNTSGAAIAQGTPVYQTGTVGATATIEIAPADALISANKLPAIGLLQTALNNNGLGFVVITGELTNFTTSPIDGVVPTTGDKVFVKSGGGLTLTKPTGEGNGIQNMGLVGKVSGGNAGSITVSSIMRTNDVPNLPEGRIWIGDGNTIVSDTVYVDEPNNRVGIGTATLGAKLDVNGAGNFSGGAVVSGIDTYTNVGVAIEKGDYLYSNDGSYLRKIIGQQSGGSIDIGQQGTSLISNINFFPGTSGNIDFFGSGSIDMRVASSGEVGIGTTNPDSLLNLEGAKNTSIITLGSTTNNSSWSVGDKIGAINFYSADGSGAGAGVKASISYEVEAGTTGSTNSMIFRSAGTGAGTNNTERMRIDSAGNVQAATFVGALSGNAATASTLQTARTIAGVSFNGSANISLNNNAITNGAGYITSASLPAVGNGQIDGRTSGLGLSGSMDATANQSGNTTFTVTSNATTAATANTIAYRDSSADLNVRLLKANYQDQTTISGAMAYRVNNGADNYTRYCSSPSAIRTFLGAGTGDITAVTAGTFLTGGGTSGNVTLNADASKLAHIVDSANASVTAGWITVAVADTARRAGEIYVTDGESGDHSFIRIDWMRSYADSNFTVINCGGHANRIQGVRVLQEAANATYGPKYLQVKVTATSNYYVIITAPGTIPNYSDLTAVTPVLENTKTGYSVTGAQLEDLQNSSVGTDEGITVGGDLFVNGGDIVLGGTGRIQGVDTVSATTDAANKAYVDNAVAAAPQGTVTGSGTAGYIPKWGTTSALANSSALYNGTSGLLNINNTFSGSPVGSSSSPDLWITGSTTNSQAVVALMNAKTISTANQVNGDIEFGTKDDSSAGYVSARIRGIQTSASASGNAGRGELQFATNVGNTGASPSTRMVINYTGNVGIGTTSPLEKLEVQGTIYATPISYASNQNAYVFKMGANNNTAFDQGIKIKSTSGGVSYMSFNSRNEDTLVLKNANVGIGTADPQATLHIDNPQTSSNNIGVILEGAQGGYSTIGMKVNIADYGEGIRFVRSSIYNGNALKFFNNTSQVGSVFVNTSSTSYNTTSDYRSKENVVPMENSINRLKELKPCRFNFIIEPENTVDGFIAHEAQEVVPESVTGEKDKLDYEGNPEYQGIDQSKLVPLLTSALQEAINKIEQLETRMQTLENN